MSGRGAFIPGGRMGRRTFAALGLGAGGAALWAAVARARREALPAPGGGREALLPDGRTLVEEAALAFGTTVTALALHPDPARARRGALRALEAVREVDRELTVHRSGSEVGRLNAEGRLSRPGRHLLAVLSFSRELSAASGGAFDVTVQPLYALWSGCRAEGRLPTPAELDGARARVGWDRVEHSPREVRLGLPGMAVTLNGVAQGYAADLALAALREEGIGDALVDAGEHGAEGRRADGGPWRLGLRHPRREGALAGAGALDGRFLAVSGDYASAFTEDLLHHHVLDPHTGDSPPSLSGAVVAAPTGMAADGLTKPMMILPRDEARRLLTRFPGAGAAWLDKDGGIVETENLDVEPAA